MHYAFIIILIIFVLIGITKQQIINEARCFKNMNNCSCCNAFNNDKQWRNQSLKQRTLPSWRILKVIGNGFMCTFHYSRQWIRRFVDHRTFQQAILLAILVNTLSMGIEYHNQVYFIFLLSSKHFETQFQFSLR